MIKNSYLLIPAFLFLFINAVTAQVSDSMVPDFRFLAYNHDGVFIANKGDRWSIIDYNGVYVLDAKKIRNPYSVFEIDSESYALLDKVKAVFIENEGAGVIDMKGNILVPAIYDEVEESYGIDGATYAVRKNANSDEWQILDSNYQEKPYTIYGDQWAGHSFHNCHLITQNKARIFNLATGEETSFDKEDYPEKFILSGSMYDSKGVVDNTGNVILPMEFNRIDDITLNDLEHAYIGRKGGVSHLYDHGGNCVTNKFAFESISRVCLGPGVFFRIEKNQLVGIMKYDGVSAAEVIFPMEYISVSCWGSSPEEPLARGTKEDGGYFELWANGKLVKLK